MTRKMPRLDAASIQTIPIDGRAAAALLRRLTRCERGNGGEIGLLAALALVIAGSLLVDTFNPRS